LVTELLEFLSGDSWHLTFVPENQAPTGNGHQTRLPLRSIRADRVALFSGGLDSMAGLASRLIHGTSSYALLTVSHQASLRASCLGATRKLQEILRIPPIEHFYVGARLRYGKAL